MENIKGFCVALTGLVVGILIAWGLVQLVGIVYTVVTSIYH
jgi:hypothetical protein